MNHQSIESDVESKIRSCPAGWRITPCNETSESSNSSNSSHEVTTNSVLPTTTVQLASDDDATKGHDALRRWRSEQSGSDQSQCTWNTATDLLPLEPEVSMLVRLPSSEWDDRVTDVKDIQRFAQDKSIVEYENDNDDHHHHHEKDSLLTTDLLPLDLEIALLVETPSQSFVDSNGNRQDVLYVQSSTTGKREVAVDSKGDEKQLFLLNQNQRKVTACKSTLAIDAKIRQPQHVVGLNHSLLIGSSEFDNNYQRKLLLANELLINKKNINNPNSNSPGTAKPIVDINPKEERTYETVLDMIDEKLQADVQKQRLENNPGTLVPPLLITSHHHAHANDSINIINDEELVNLIMGLTDGMPEHEDNLNNNPALDDEHKPFDEIMSQELIEPPNRILFSNQSATLVEVIDNRQENARLIGMSTLPEATVEAANCYMDTIPQATPLSPPPQPRQTFRRRNLVAFATLGVLIVVAGVATAVALLINRNNNSQANTTTASLASAPPASPSVRTQPSRSSTRRPTRPIIGTSPSFPSNGNTYSPTTTSTGTASPTTASNSPLSASATNPSGATTTLSPSIFTPVKPNVGQPSMPTFAVSAPSTPSKTSTLGISSGHVGSTALHPAKQVGQKPSVESQIAALTPPTKVRRPHHPLASETQGDHSSGQPTLVAQQPGGNPATPSDALPAPFSSSPSFTSPNLPSSSIPQIQPNTLGNPSFASTSPQPANTATGPIKPSRSYSPSMSQVSGASPSPSSTYGKKPDGSSSTPHILTLTASHHPFPFSPSLRSPGSANPLTPSSLGTTSFGDPSITGVLQPTSPSSSPRTSHTTDSLSPNLIGNSPFIVSPIPPALPSTPSSVLKFPSAVRNPSSFGSPQTMGSPPATPHEYQLPTRTQGAGSPSSPNAIGKMPFESLSMPPATPNSESLPSYSTSGPVADSMGWPLDQPFASPVITSPASPETKPFPSYFTRTPGSESLGSPQALPASDIPASTSSSTPNAISNAPIGSSVRPHSSPISAPVPSYFATRPSAESPQTLPQTTPSSSQQASTSSSSPNAIGNAPVGSPVTPQASSDNAPVPSYNQPTSAAESPVSPQATPSSTTSSSPITIGNAPVGSLPGTASVPSYAPARPAAESPSLQVATPAAPHRSRTPLINPDAGPSSLPASLTSSSPNAIETRPVGKPVVTPRATHHPSISISDTHGSFPTTSNPTPWRDSVGIPVASPSRQKPSIGPLNSPLATPILSHAPASSSATNPSHSEHSSPVVVNPTTKATAAPLCITANSVHCPSVNNTPTSPSPPTKPSPSTTNKPPLPTTVATNGAPVPSPPNGAVAPQSPPTASTTKHPSLPSIAVPDAAPVPSQPNVAVAPQPTTKRPALPTISVPHAAPVPSQPNIAVAPQPTTKRPALPTISVPHAAPVPSQPNVAAAPQPQLPTTTVLTKHPSLPSAVVPHADPVPSQPHVAVAPQAPTMALKTKHPNLSINSFPHDTPVPSQPNFSAEPQPPTKRPSLPTIAVPLAVPIPSQPNVAVAPQPQPQSPSTTSTTKKPLLPTIAVPYAATMPSRPNVAVTPQSPTTTTTTKHPSLPTNVFPHANPVPSQPNVPVAPKPITTAATKHPSLPTAVVPHADPVPNQPNVAVAPQTSSYPASVITVRPNTHITTTPAATPTIYHPHHRRPADSPLTASTHTPVVIAPPSSPSMPLPSPLKPFPLMAPEHPSNLSLNTPSPSVVSRPHTSYPVNMNSGKPYGGQSNVPALYPINSKPHRRHPSKLPSSQVSPPHATSTSSPGGPVGEIPLSKTTLTPSQSPMRRHSRPTGVVAIHQPSAKPSRIQLHQPIKTSATIAPTESPSIKRFIVFVTDRPVHAPRATHSPSEMNDGPVSPPQTTSSPFAAPVTPGSTSGQATGVFATGPPVWVTQQPAPQYAPIPGSGGGQTYAPQSDNGGVITVIVGPLVWFTRPPAPHFAPVPGEGGGKTFPPINFPSDLPSLAPSIVPSASRPTRSPSPKGKPIVATSSDAPSIIPSTIPSLRRNRRPKLQPSVPPTLKPSQILTLPPFLRLPPPIHFTGTGGTIYGGGGEITGSGYFTGKPFGGNPGAGNGGSIPTPSLNGRRSDFPSVAPSGIPSSRPINSSVGASTGSTTVNTGGTATRPVSVINPGTGGGSISPNTAVRSDLPSVAPSIISFSARPITGAITGTGGTVTNPGGAGIVPGVPPVLSPGDEGKQTLSPNAGHSDLPSVAPSTKPSSRPGLHASINPHTSHRPTTVPSISPFTMPSSQPFSPSDLHEEKPRPTSTVVAGSDAPSIIPSVIHSSYHHNPQPEFMPSATTTSPSTSTKPSSAPSNSQNENAVR